MPLPLLVALLALADWKTYPLGGMIVDLPAAPRTVSNEGVQQTWLVESEDDGFVTLTATPALVDLPIVTLSSFAQGAALGYHGRLVEQRDLVLNGWPGLEGRIESEGMPDGRFRVYRVRDRMLVLMSMMDGEATDRIFKSLALAPRFGKGPQAQAGPRWRRARLDGLSVEMPEEPAAEADRLTGSYGNRTYELAVSKEDPAQAAEAAFRANGAKVATRDARILADAATQRLEGTALDGTMVFVAESLIVNGKTVTLTALVPAAMKGSPEVRRFFDSLRAS